MLVSLLASPGLSAAATLQVAAGGDFQAALNAARPGDVIVLQAGARFVGAFQLPAKPSGPVITIQSSAALPARRVTPADAPLMPTIASGSVQSAITAIGVSNWRLDGLRFESNSTGQGDVIALQDATNIVMDRLLIVAAPQGQRRGVLGNGRQITLTRSHIAQIWRSGQDSQAFCAWDGAGPYTITDNYLEAASENVMFGGADSRSSDRVPADILVERNHFSKPWEWQGQSRNVKNLFELKAAKRVTVRNNVFERNWTDGQTGWAIVLTPRNQDGTAPWSVVEDVLFERNVVRDTFNGINVSGSDDIHPSGRTTRITIRHNLFQLLDGSFLQIGAEAGEVTIDHNTVLGVRWRIAMLTRGTLWENGVKRSATYSARPFRFTNNLTPHGEYGVFGDGVSAVGTNALAILTPGYTWTHNVVAGGSQSFPAVTWRPSLQQFAAQFDAASQLVATSVYRGAATDGKDVGVHWDPALPRIPRATPNGPVLTGRNAPVWTPGRPFLVAALSGVAPVRRRARGSRARRRRSATASA